MKAKLIEQDAASLSYAMNRMEDNRGQAEVGKSAVAMWFDEGVWYEGVIEALDDGELGIALPNDTWGSIEGAFHVIVLGD